MNAAWLINGLGVGALLVFAIVYYLSAPRGSDLAGSAGARGAANPDRPGALTAPPKNQERGPT